MSVATLMNGFPSVNAGLLADGSIRLSSSTRLGSRHWPGVEPSLSPHPPLASPFASATAADHTAGAKQPPFLSQIRPVKLSVTVPSWLSVSRCCGQATPFFRSPSSPRAYDAVWPVRGRFTTGLVPSYAVKFALLTELSAVAT